MKAVVATFNQEQALVGAFSVIVQPVVEPMERFAALVVRGSSVEDMVVTWRHPPDPSNNSRERKFVLDQAPCLTRPGRVKIGSSGDRMMLKDSS